MAGELRGHRGGIFREAYDYCVSTVLTVGNTDGPAQDELRRVITEIYFWAKDPARMF